MYRKSAVPKWQLTEVFLVLVNFHERQGRLDFKPHYRMAQLHSIGHGRLLDFITV